MQVKALKVFCDVVEQRSFSEAAACCRVARRRVDALAAALADAVGS